MKKVKEYLIEKFTEEGDPIKDMGIGKKQQILKDLEKKGLSENDVKFEDDYTFFMKDGRKSQPTGFEDVQLKHFPEGKKQLLYGLEKTKDDIVQLIDNAVKDGVDKQEIFKIIEYVLTGMTWGDKRIELSSSDMQKAKIYLAKISRTKKQKAEEEKNNIYVFIGYEGKVATIINGKKYYEDKFMAETMVKFDKYDVGQLQSVSMMKLRARVQYGSKNDVGVYMFTVPKDIMNKDKYDGIPEQYYDLVVKYKKQIG
jgi:hypothetical protein